MPCWWSIPTRAQIPPRVKTVNRATRSRTRLARLNRPGRRSIVIVRDTKRIPYAYPVYDQHHARNTGILRRWFESLGIDQLGRFAEFDYINSDECIHRAMRLAEKLNSASRLAG